MRPRKKQTAKRPVSTYDQTVPVSYTHLGEDAYDHLVKFTNIQLGIYPSFVKGQRGIDAVNLKAMAEGVTVIGG